MLPHLGHSGICRRRPHTAKSRLTSKMEMSDACVFNVGVTCELQPPPPTSVIRASDFRARAGDAGVLYKRAETAVADGFGMVGAARRRDTLRIADIALLSGRGVTQGVAAAPHSCTKFYAVGRKRLVATKSPQAHRMFQAVELLPQLGLLRLGGSASGDGVPPVSALKPQTRITLRRRG